MEQKRSVEKAKVYAYLRHLSEVGYKMRRPFADYMGDIEIALQRKEICEVLLKFNRVDFEG